MIFLANARNDSIIQQLGHVIPSVSEESPPILIF
jgi:hypothetical protein